MDSICLTPNIGCSSHKEKPQRGKQRQLRMEVDEAACILTQSLSVTLGRVTT